MIRGMWRSAPRGPPARGCSWCRCMPTVGSPRAQGGRPVCRRSLAEPRTEVHNHEGSRYEYSGPAEQAGDFFRGARRRQISSPRAPVSRGSGVRVCVGGDGAPGRRHAVLRIYDWRGPVTVELSGPRQNTTCAAARRAGGIFDAPVTQVEIRAATLPGAIPVTVRVAKRAIDLPVIVQGADLIAWQWWNRRLRRPLSPTHDSPLVVATLPWGPRWIGVRLRENPDDVFGVDPTLSRSHIWNLQFDAYDPGLA